MAIDATFWVAVSFIIFFGALIYLKIPQKISEMLDKMISDIKNEIDESEKLRTEAKTLLDNAQKKLDSAGSIKNEILEQAKKEGFDVLILDTAGRLQIDDELMTEVKDVSKAVNPSEILLVSDAMIGQESVNVAKEFNNKLNKQFKWRT